MHFIAFLSIFVAFTWYWQVKDGEWLTLDSSFDEQVESLPVVLHLPGASLAIIDGDNINTKVRSYWTYKQSLLTASRIWICKIPRGARYAT